MTDWRSTRLAWWRSSKGANRGAPGPGWRSSEGGPCNRPVHASDHCTHASTHYNTITEHTVTEYCNSEDLCNTSEGVAPITSSTHCSSSTYYSSSGNSTDL